MTADSERAAVAEPQRRPIEPADLYELASVGAIAINPSGDGIVHTLTWPDRTSDSNASELHLFRDGLTRPLVRGRGDTLPRFSADGSRLAFVRSLGAAGSAAMILDWASLRLRRAAVLADGISSLQWLDADRLVVTAVGRPSERVGVSADELARLPRRIERLDYRFNGDGARHDRRHQVLIVDLTRSPGDRDDPPDSTAGSGDGGDGTAAGDDEAALVTPLDQLVTDAGYDVAGADHLAVAPSPDGTGLAMIVGGLGDDDLTGANAVWALTLDGTTPGRQLTPAGGDWAKLVWHHDGPIVAVGRTDASTHGFARPHVLATNGDAPSVLGPHDVNAAPPIGPGASLIAVDGGVLAPGSRRGAMTIDHYRLDDGSVEIRCQGRFQVVAFDATTDGSEVAAAITSTDRPAELWRVAPDGPERLSSVNDELLDHLDLARTDEVEVATDDGHTIHAFITRPPASVAASTEPAALPGLVYVHGGPMSQYGFGFFDEFQMAAAAGYVVIGANPTGSDGYGEAWATTSVRVGGGSARTRFEVAVTDHLASLPEVDEQRIGIGGGSYGGFMAAWAIGHSDRYRAALVERSVTNWLSMAGTSDIGPYFVPELLGATIETDAESLARQSPLTHVTGATTPTLILHSEQDWRCPIEQAEQLFAALRRNGCDATLVRFPGESHELSRSGSPRHRCERFDIIGEFFDRHLKPGPG